MPSSKKISNYNYLLKQIKGFFADFPQERVLQTKPLYEVLNDLRISNVEIVESIINYCNQNFTEFTTISKTEQFWYDVIDLYEENKQSYVFDSNEWSSSNVVNSSNLKYPNPGKFVNQLQSIYVKNDDWKWIPESGSLLMNLIKIQKLVLNPDEFLSNEEGKNTVKELVNKVDLIIENKKKELPIRQEYWRFNEWGVYTKVKNPNYVYPSHSARCGGGNSPTNNPHEKSECFPENSRKILDEYNKYWLQKNPGKYLFGLEQEVSIPKNRVAEFLKKCEESGLCEKNLIYPSYDVTVKTNINGKEYVNAEINVQPLTYDEAKEVWAKLGKCLAEVDSVFGAEAGAGGHIHVDKPKDTIKQVQIAKHFIKNVKDLSKFFGRGQIINDFQTKKFKDTYGNKMGLKINDLGGDIKIIENVIRWKQTLIMDDNQPINFPEGKVLATANFEINAEGRGILNYQNAKTIEFRGFNSIPNPERNLEVLAQELSKVLGKEVVYGKEDVPEYVEVIDFRKELNNSLKSLGYDDEDIKLGLSANFEKAENLNAWILTAVKTITKARENETFEEPQELEHQNEEEHGI